MLLHEEKGILSGFLMVFSRVVLNSLRSSSNFDNFATSTYSFLVEGVFGLSFNIEVAFGSTTSLEIVEFYPVLINVQYKFHESRIRYYRRFTSNFSRPKLHNIHEYKTQTSSIKKHIDA